jgi:hypothetical protein
MSVNNYALHGKIIIIIVVATRPNVERNACMYRCNNQMRHVRVRAELIKREIKGNTNTKSYWFSKGRVKGVPWLPCRGSRIFRLIPLVFILREAKRTSGGTRYKSLSLPCWRCRLKTCKTGFIFCDVFKLPGLSYYQNSSLELQPCVKY